MTPTLRIGRPADVEAVLRLWVRAGAHPTNTDDVEGLRALIEHGGSALLVAVDSGASGDPDASGVPGVLVGSVIAGWDGWRGSIYRLAVDPAHRHRGLGRRLVTAAESHLRGVGAVRLAAVVVETDPTAAGFWMAAEGWECQDHRLRFVKG